MNPSTRRSTGPQRGHQTRPPFTPYGPRQPSGRQLSVLPMTTRSIPTSMLARQSVSTTSYSQLNPSLSAVNNPQADDTIYLLPPWKKIPQDPYVPARNQGEFTHAKPVSFSVNGVPGISVAQAVAGEFTGLDKRDDEVSSFEANKIICRIQFTGGSLYTSQVNTRRHVAEWAPIVRWKLAKEIGRRVKECIEKQGLEATLDVEKVYLVRLIQVSKGSWQPELFYPDTVTLGFVA